MANCTSQRWRRHAASARALGCLLAAGCGPGVAKGSLVGVYDVRGSLVENTCGNSALPAVNPLSFQVELREDNGIGYWSPSKQSSNQGSFTSSGQFSFTTTQTTVLSTMQVGQNAQPSDFTSLQPNFDLQQRSCAITTQQSITGSVRRRDAADGGMPIALAIGDAGSLYDLSADNVIQVTPTSGSNCDSQLMAFGGTYLALPCDARYALTGTLLGASSAPAAAQTAAAGGSATPVKM